MFAFEYLGERQPGAVFDDTYAREELGVWPNQLRSVLNRRLAHVSTARFVNPWKPDYSRGLTGTRRLYSKFIAQLDEKKTEWFAAGYDEVSTRS